jgi:hypothetical protein
MAFTTVGLCIVVLLIALLSLGVFMGALGSRSAANQGPRR